MLMCMETNEARGRSAATSKAVSRRYRMRKRREDIEETRQRIVVAAVELHGSVGPAHTTFSAVAERAGVQRSTLYRHFPDEEALFGACTSHWFAAHPWPTSSTWETLADPVERVGLALRDMYRYFDTNQQMLGNAYRDMDVLPAFVGDLLRAQTAASHATLTAPWPAKANRDRLSAAVSLALDFRVWQSLHDLRLDAEAAADLMTEMVAAVALRGDSVRSRQAASRS
jgi:AcrR family transcriptional regulator